MMNFFSRYRVLLVGIVGLAAIHTGWYYIARSPTFNPTRKTLDITPAYYKSKRAKQASQAAADKTK